MTLSRRTLIKTGAGGTAASLTVGTGTARAAAVRTAVRTATGTSTVYGVSVGRTEITPSVVGAPDAWLAGYATDGRTATGTARALYARCLILRDQGRPVILVTADVLAYSRTVHQAVRAQMNALGIADGDFLMTATHTHSGPVLDERLDPVISYHLTPGNVSDVHTYTQWLTNAIISLVTNTLSQTPVPCTLNYAVDSSAVAYNREGLANIDHAVPVMTIVPTSGSTTPMAILFGYACHPVARGSDNVYDSDYPGIVEARLETRFPGTTAFFLTGAAGDQNPVLRNGSVPVAVQGAEVYRAVLRAVSSGGRAVNGSITTRYSELSLPFALNQEPMSSFRATYAARVAADPSGTTPTGRHAAEMILQIDSNTLPTAMPLPIQMWGFDGAQPLKLAAIGGEPVSGYSIVFKNALGGDAALWVAGYANEIPAYVPSDEMLVDGGYAAGWTVSPLVTDDGGSIMFYGWPCRFMSGTGGIESSLTSAVTAMAGTV
ncbi:MAG TPA: neutral/alkaline non-lysosomal ceramidase N-terminal domain-containing protein [Actinocrinis sp.]|nr:neutral/alkaline non-lysosomal ceramidase N-terminal domain-containing protein [Actinocrinis sp.]